MSAYDPKLTAKILSEPVEIKLRDIPAGLRPILINMARIADQLRAASDRISQLERALLKYGWHAQRCDFLQNELPCTCGYEELRAALAGDKAGDKA